jgi:transposase
MVVLGADTHKRSHTVVAADEAGVELDSISVAATLEGHLKLVEWAAGFGAERRWAIEDCRALSRRLEADLLGVGESVVRVPPKLMAGTRCSARTQGKSDPIDGLAVARSALREPDLPVARLDGPARELRCWSTTEKAWSETGQQLRTGCGGGLHELEPGYDPARGSLNRYKTLDEVSQLLAAHESVVADLARREVNRIRELTEEANQIERDISRRVGELAPSLLEIPGCGALSAAKLVGEAADITRFRNRDAYAMWAGTAPIPVWSANNRRHRLNRGGNRAQNTP